MKPLDPSAKRLAQLIAQLADVIRADANPERVRKSAKEVCRQSADIVAGRVVMIGGSTSELALKIQQLAGEL